MKIILDIIIKSWELKKKNILTILSHVLLIKQYIKKKKKTKKTIKILIKKINLLNQKVLKTKNILF